MESKIQKRSVFSWALYDWANSAFATTVMAGFFPLFFKAYWSNPNNLDQSTLFLGMANSLASIIVALLAPYLGAIADKGSGKKKFLMTFAFLGVMMTGSLWFLDAGQWLWAALFYMTATIGFSGGNIFYDSLLPSVSTKKNVDWVSSLGLALGYIGGGLLFAVNVLMYLHPEWFGISGKATAIKLSFVSVAIWWAVFSLPILIWVKEPKSKDKLTPIQAIKAGGSQLVHTFKNIKNLKIVFMFLLAYWFYIDGVDTIVRMAVDYGMSLGFTSSNLITALLMVQFIAFPGALLYSWFAKLVGVKKAVLVAIIAYMGITLLGYFMTKVVHFYILAALVALFQGGIQALSRSLYSRLIPKEQAAEFYGFFNMLGKFAAVIGPTLVGVVTVLSKNHRLGILSLLILFLTGFVLLIQVNLQQGENLSEKLK